jgi:REP element-mobilizing transposase RayT
MPHRPRPKHRGDRPVHVTVRTVRGVSLRGFGVAARVGKSLRAMVGAGRAQEFRVCEFSLQDDHVHLLVEARDRDALSRGMRAVNIRLARAVNLALGRRGRVVQDRHHEHVLRTPTEVRHALLYVMHNGHKHRAPADEFVDQLDTRSSARWSRAWRDHTPDPTPSPTSPPRTYLLAVLWKDKGLLDRSERPRQRAA